MALAGCLFLVLAFVSGCARNAGSPVISPPRDPATELHRATLDSMLNDPEMVLQQPAEYYIGPGDVLNLALLGRPDILGEKVGAEDSGQQGLTIRVTETPTITLPLIGAINVHGKTVDQLQEELTAAFSRYVKDPVVIVSIEEYAQNQVTVLGVVNEPGRYPWTFGDTVLDALFQAGGLAFTNRGGLPPGRFLRLYRQKITQKEASELPIAELFERLSENERLEPWEEYTIPIEEFILNGNLVYNLPVRPGDILYVPTAGSVIVMGHINNPGVTYLGPSLHTLAHVITERGGLKYGADSDLEIVRSFEDGSQESYFIDARKILGRKEPDFLLKDGDQIFVYKHPVRYPLEIIGSIFSTTATTGVNATYSPAVAP